MGAGAISQALAEDPEIAIKDLPRELREDVIVMAVSFADGRTATKAISVSLLDDGTFFASFGDYEITPQDKFIQRPDSAPVPNGILYAQGSSAALNSRDDILAEGTGATEPAVHGKSSARDTKIRKAPPLRGGAFFTISGMAPQSHLCSNGSRFSGSLRRLSPSGWRRTGSFPHRDRIR